MTRKRDPEAHRSPTGRMIPCPGEAHRNAYIDSCGLCAPRWGTVPELADIDIQAARAAGLDVPAPEMTRDQYVQAQAYVDAGLATWVQSQVHRGRAYFVIRWTSTDGHLAWTDYPFGQLGDRPFVQAPVRPVVVLARADDRRVWIRVQGQVAEVKAGYCYQTPGRQGEVQTIDFPGQLPFSSDPPGGSHA